jgi:hypothetical protein
MPVIPWNITGTDNQQAILREAFNRIKFPFEKISLPGAPEMGWRDLNGSDEWWLARPRMHGDEHHHDENEDRPEPLNGELEGRKWIMGVFFPGSARIFLDRQLEQYPDLAMAVVGAEIAHAVDEFLPMSDEQRGAIMALWHKDGADDHTWWEKYDYNAEYYTLGGEAFMHEFVSAYSELPFGDKSAFGHHDAGVEPENIWQILGIRRTDAVLYKRIGTSTIYHKLTHYPKSSGTVISDITGLRPCKVCRP